MSKDRVTPRKDVRNYSVNLCVLRVFVLNREVPPVGTNEQPWLVMPQTGLAAKPAPRIYGSFMFPSVKVSKSDCLGRILLTSSRLGFNLIV